MAVFISLTAGAINVNALNRGSVIAVGEISQPGWNQNGKMNLGNGELFGANVQACFVTTILDNDVIDNPMSEIEPATSIQNKVV